VAWLVANALFAAIGLFLIPSIVGDFWAYTLALYFLYAIACLGIGLSWGQAGLLSLGQGFFVGIGAYLSGLSLIAYADSRVIYLLILGCAAAPGLLAYLIGKMIFHGRAKNSAFFALITLALVLLAFQIATSWNAVTGGYNGLQAIPGIPGMDGFEDAYTLSAVALWVAILLTAWTISTPLGVLWRALAQDERRLAFLGFDPNHLKAVAFGLSGLLGGLAGALYAPENNLVTPDLFSFALSTSFVVWVAIGGRSTLYGPVLGAIVIGMTTAYLRETISYWEVVLAAFFIIVVLYFKQGVLGILEPLLSRRLLNRGRKPVAAPERRREADNGTLSMAHIDLRAGGVDILNDLSLTIEKAGIYCLIGPNGAGKTSAFNALTGELAPQAGSIELLGRQWPRPDPCRLTRFGLARKFQTPNLFDDLTIGEHLGIALWAGRAEAKDLVVFGTLDWTSPVREELERRFDFLSERDRNVRDLSHGERQLLDLAMVLCTEPKIILLDEPCAGLSLAETKHVIDAIRWAVDAFHATAVIIEHDMALVRELADHVFVLHNGRLLAQGSIDDMQQNPDVRSVYAGGTK